MPETVMTDGALQRQLNDIGERMEKGFDRLEKLMTGVEVRVREVEKREASCSPMLQGRLDAAWREIDEHKVKIEKLEKAVEALVQTNSILKWLLGVSTTVLVALLIKLIVGA